MKHIPDSLMKMDPNVLAKFSDFGIIVEFGMGFTDRSIGVTCTCHCANVKPLGSKSKISLMFEATRCAILAQLLSFDRPWDICNVGVFLVVMQPRTRS